MSLTIYGKDADVHLADKAYRSHTGVAAVNRQDYTIYVSAGRSGEENSC